jgi:hypothetical protein
MTPFYILFHVTHELSVVEAGDDYRVSCTCGFLTGTFISRGSAELRLKYDCEIAAIAKTSAERREQRQKAA